MLNNKHTKSESSILFLLLPICIALIARLVVFYSWLASPFRYYHTIRGLDMFKITNLFTDSYLNSGSFSDLYIYLYGTVLRMTNGINTIEVMVIIQMLIGVLSVFLVTLISNKIFTNRIIAFLSGALFAVYSPALMYECFILKETLFMFLCLLLFCFALNVKSRKYSNLSFLILGIFAALPGLIRFSGLLWGFSALIWSLVGYYFLGIKTTGKIYTQNLGLVSKLNNILLKLIFFIFGLFIILTPLHFLNNGNLCGFSTIKNTQWIRYILKVGGQSEIKTMNIVNNEGEKETEDNRLKTGDERQEPEIRDDSKLPQTDSKLLSTYIRKFFMLFDVYEIPNNLNYYFIKDGLKPLKYLLSPFILLPIAIAGGLILLFYIHIYFGTTILYFFILPTIISSTIFLPIARYRIIMIPIFCIFAAFFIYKIFSSLFRLGFICIGICILVYLTVLSLELTYTKNDYYRASDYITYGHALKYQNSKNPKILLAYEIAYETRPDLKKNLFYYSDELMKNNQFKKATEILLPEYEKEPNNIDIILRYSAALLGTNNPKQSLKILQSVPEPEANKQKIEYFYNIAESHFLLQNYPNANKYYEKILKLNPNENYLNFIQIRMMQIESQLNIQM